MSAVARSLPNLIEAVTLANHSLQAEGKGYAVEALPNIKNDFKKPVFLRLFAENKSPKLIGVVYLVDLTGDDWANTPPEMLAKTTEEVAQKILNRVTLYLAVETRLKGRQSNLLITEVGTIFDFSNIECKINEDMSFALNERVVTYGGKNTNILEIHSEGIITFKYLKKGCVQLCDEFDKRKGLELIVNEKGEIPFRKHIDISTHNIYSIPEEKDLEDEAILAIT